MQEMILVAETGSDIPPTLAEEYGIRLVPMHVTLGDKTLDDGSFPVEEICAHYARTGNLPKTSGCSPEDFARVYREIRAAHPEARILHLAYSAVTTVSYQSAKIAAEGLEGITHLDTKHVSVGQAAVVIGTAQYLRAHPSAAEEEVLRTAEDLSRRARMCFVPDDLEYLRAGGRISNVAYYLGGRLLRLHPRVELLDGQLIATKKYRGKMLRIVQELIRDYTEENQLMRDHLWLLYTTGLSEEIRAAAEATAKDCGFQSVSWLEAQCVITTHGGPGAFAMAGFAEE